MHSFTARLIGILLILAAVCAYVNVEEPPVISFKTFHVLHLDERVWIVHVYRHANYRLEKWL